MTRVKTNGVNGTTKHTTNKTSFVVVGKNSGHGSGSKPSQTDDTQEPLATQSPVRPPSRDSIKSQDGDNGGYTHEGLATQVYPSNPPQNLPMAALTSTMSNHLRNGASLLRHLGNGNRQKPSPKQRPPPGQESQQVADNSSPSGSPSSDSGTSDEHTDKENEISTVASQPEHTSISPQGQKRNPSPPSREKPSLQRPNKSSGNGFEKADINSQEEITSFQVQLPSSSETTGAVTENGNNPVGPPENDLHVDRPRSTEPARKEKNSSNDPWSNMKKLRRRDVFIPEDQEELLDRPDCWIPPDVGHPYPRGHVPPSLLREWNGKMIRLFSDARRTHTSSQKAEPSREQEEEDHVASSNPLSDDERDSDSESEASWSQSPPQHLRKPMAPPDSSPIRPHDARQPINIAEESRINGTSEPVDGVRHQSKVTTPQPASQLSQQAESTQSIDSAIVDQGQNLDLFKEAQSAVHVTPEDSRPEGEVAELDDDSEMDTSIPQALFVRSQDVVSQVEFSEAIAPNSSDTASAPAAQVQILNTPAAGLKRAAAQRTENAPSHLQEWTGQKSSSGSNKSSSQSIANSIDSTAGSSGQEDQLQDAQRPLVADSQGTNVDLHGSSLPSHQDSQRMLEVIPESSFPSADLHTQESDTSPGERVEGGPNPSKDIVTERGLKRSAAELDAEVTDESPSKRARKSPNGNVNPSTTQNITEVEYDIVNGDSHEHVCFNKDALRVYDMFKRSYPKYAGNFDHFQTLCYKLQLLHRREILQNSSLWDDFIMRHWVDYGTYVQNCVSANENYESYEDFFCRHFTKPSFRKRSLTPRTLKTVVSKLESSVEKHTTVERAVQTIDDNSVSASVSRRSPFVVDRRFRSTSREANTQSTTSDVVVVVEKPRQANIGIKLSAPSSHTNKGPIIVDGDIQINLEPPTPSHLLDSGRPGHVEDENRVRGEIQETQPPDNNIVTDEDISDNGTNSAEEFTTHYHDPASIERHLDEAMEEETENHDDNNNNNSQNDPDNVVEAEARFEQISRMRRDNSQALQALFRTEVPPPPEEQDESTPFKIWARDDHNIVSERRRRGGYKVPLDKNGNIVFEEFLPRIGVDGGGHEEVSPPFSRWLWRCTRDIT